MTRSSDVILLTRSTDSRVCKVERIVFSSCDGRCHASGHTSFQETTVSSKTLKWRVRHGHARKLKILVPMQRQAGWLETFVIEFLILRARRETMVQLLPQPQVLRTCLSLPIEAEEWLIEGLFMDRQESSGAP